MNTQADKPSTLDLSYRLWYCTLVIVALIGVVLYARGFDLMTVILIGLALVCPAVLIWGVSLLRKPVSNGRRGFRKS